MEFRSRPVRTYQGMSDTDHVLNITFVGPTTLDINDALDIQSFMLVI